MSRPKHHIERRRRQTRKRTLLITGVVVLLAAAAIGLSVFQATRPLGEIRTVPLETFPFVDGAALGAVDAPVRIQLYSDFQCPYCGLYALEHERRLIDEFVAAGRVRFEYKHYIVIDGNVGGNESRRAAEASECASEQGEFWNYHNLVFANQNGEGRGGFSDRRLKAFAETLGLDTAAFNACFDSGRYTQVVLADEREARSLGVNSTPTMFINNVRVINPLDYDEIRRQVELALSAR